MYDGELREYISNFFLKKKLKPFSIISKHSHIDKSSDYGHGLLAMPSSVVHKKAIIGSNCLLNVNSVIDHEAIVGNGVHIMGSAYIAGRVKIGDYASIGANATILPDLTIGKRAIVGAGAVVTKNVKADEVVAGNPARFLKKNKISYNFDVLKFMIKVGFILNFNKEDWLGGYNYYRNLFYFLKNSNNQKIEPIILTDSLSRYKNDKHINKLKIIENNFFSKSNIVIRIFHKVLVIFFGKNFFLESMLTKNNIKAISHKGFLGKYSKIKSFPWFPDFQEIYFPENFSKKDLILRRLDIFFSKIHGTKIIISSKQVRSDLKKIDEGAFKKSTLLKHPINLPKPEFLPSFSQLKRKYNIKKKYFFLPNHYWKHKNHMIVLEALKQLVKKNFIVISTGQTYDHRDPAYFRRFKKTIKDKNITKHYKILGIVPFEDMIALMLHSIAVINPSKSEGLSNTVEQAKALGKAVILSNISIHKEQKGNNFFYFNPDNYLELAAILFKLSIKKAIKMKSNRLNKKLLNEQTIFINKYQNFIISNLKN